MDVAWVLVGLIVVAALLCVHVRIGPPHPHVVEDEEQLREG